MKIFKYLVASFIMIILSMPATAQDSTRVVVRAKAKDAKFIGTSMGGAMIRIFNAETGELLAKGLTEGSTGDTERLVLAANERYDVLHTEGAAKFETTLALSEPVFATIEGSAPGAQKQAQVVSSTQLWLIPGKDITGDGIILEIPGFAVDVLAPRTHSRTSQRDISIQANVVMMCGCPVSDGGLWDSSDYEIKALIKHKNETVDTMLLSFSGTANLFEGTYSATDSGIHEITVYAYDAKTGNTGVDKTTVIIE